MNILIAPDSFKGSLSAIDFCTIVEREIMKVMPSSKIVKLPMADGGEGTVDALVEALSGKRIQVKVTAPHGEVIEATYGYLTDEKIAVIEMAAASGLPLVPRAKRNPLTATTYGTGQLIKDALDKGCKKILLGIGGSATNDGGLGALAALGGRFKDREGIEIPFGGQGLLSLETIDLSDLDERLEHTEIKIACDVDNPLYGLTGAAYVYGPQKGANDEMVVQLDKGLQNMSLRIMETTGKDVSQIAGAGAAGGFGGGFVGLLNAQLLSGFHMINELVRVEDILVEEKINLIITGEGQVNHQTLNGKLPFQIAKIGKTHGCPVICIGGSTSGIEEKLYDYGITAAFSIADGPMTLEYAMANAEDLLAKVIRNIIELYRCKF